MCVCTLAALSSALGHSILADSISKDVLDGWSSEKEIQTSATVNAKHRPGEDWLTNGRA